MATVQIFLSAVSAEFRSYRDALRHDLDRPNVTVKVQEDFIATGTETLDKLDAYIRQCDAAIHLVGDMTGALAQPPSVAFVRERYPNFGDRLPAIRDFLQPDGPALSYTQWEAWLTLYHHKMLIIAVPKEGATRDLNYHFDEAQRAAQQEHLARLTKGERHREIEFANSDRLAVEVMRSGLYDILASARALSRRPRPQPAPRESDRRYLRGYAFDPHLQIRLEPGEKNEIVYSIPFEPLYPGPCGGSIEVIDHDPASGCYYEPVDLEHPDAISQDGLSPSETDPKFHQQWVYAVAMTTLELFEHALGRQMLWSARHDPETNSASFVQRLRIYPHALRSPRAYYDHQRKAILFGYFHVAADLSADNIYSEGLVFTCLSQQAVARETAMAIIAGMYPTLAASDGLDTLAFKHAFADIVGLLQHFSMVGVLRHAFARPGGVRSVVSVLAELAIQLGATSRGKGPLREAIGAHDSRETWRRLGPDPTVFARAADAETRGAVVVAAVFDAYLAVVEGCTVDLLRDLQFEAESTRREGPAPELVEPLAEEAAKIARHLLMTVVRALDYCPPIDVTPVDFLRALVTSDRQPEPQDGPDYRAAIVEAFRAHGVHPLGFRSSSAEMLVWNPPSEIATRELPRVIGPPLKRCIADLSVLNDRAERRFAILQRSSGELREAFAELFQSLRDADRAPLASELGVDAAMDATSLAIFLPRLTTGPFPESGRVFVSVVQNQPIVADIDETQAGVPSRGGSTVVVKLGTWQIERIICKSVPGR